MNNNLRYFTKGCDYKCSIERNFFLFKLLPIYYFELATMTALYLPTREKLSDVYLTLGRYSDLSDV